MRSIGVRELRQNASRYLRAVQAGETIEVTDRGHPIARLVPISAQPGIAGLLAAGRLDLPTSDLLSLGPPLAAVEGMPLPSEELERLRDDER